MILQNDTNAVQSVVVLVYAKVRRHIRQESLRFKASIRHPEENEIWKTISSFSTPTKLQKWTPRHSSLRTCIIETR